jgi:hypothetical protein
MDGQASITRCECTLRKSVVARWVNSSTQYSERIGRVVCNNVHPARVIQRASEGVVGGVGN